MTLSDIVDLIRVTTAFAAVFAGVPWLLLWIRSDKPDVLGYWAAAVQTAAFGTSAAIALGAVGLCLPGSMLTVYLLFLLGTAHLTGALPPLLHPSTGRLWLHKALVFAARGNPQGTQVIQTAVARFHGWQIHRQSAFVFAMAIALVGSLACSHYVRFLHDESYSRVLSLQQLTLGQQWTYSGAVAVLAPVVFLSSVDGAAVVRFSGPLFLGVLALVSYAAIRIRTNSSPLGLIASGIIVAFVAWYDVGELRPGSIALIAWASTLMFFWAKRPWEAFWSVILALLIEPLPTLSTMAGTAALGLIGSADGAGVIARAVKPFAVAAPSFAFLWVMAVFLSWHEGDGPQYNTVARTVTQIKRESPRNTWLIVSPVQEVALTYGHGWHKELSEFVEEFTPEQVRSPDFKFPFPVAETIFVIEKQPLASRKMAAQLSGLGPYFDPSVAQYQIRSHRNALQFRAARILDAYHSTHSDVDVLAEDQRVVVYRIRTRIEASDKDSTPHGIGKT